MEKSKNRPLESFIDVSQLLKERIGSTQSYDISGTFSQEVEGYVDGKLKLTRSNRGILVQGNFHAQVSLQCSRCLAMFSCPLGFAVEEEFLSPFDFGFAASLAEERGDFTITAQNMLNLGELIRQYVLLNLPMKPLCRPNCPGMKERS
jgi:uncharacterized protein